MEINLGNSAMTFLQIAEERGIPREKVIEVIEAALSSAYRKEYGKKGEKYRARFNPNTKKLEFFLVKKVVDKEMLLQEKEPKKDSQKIKFNPLRQIMLEEAKKIKKDVKPNEELEFPLPFPKEFGRIAIQTAKQVLIQKLREIEREVIFKKFKEKEGEIVTGIIQRKEEDRIFVDLQDAIGILPKREQNPKEFYKITARMKFLCLETRNTPRGPEIILSRRHPKFLTKLFELEVPEISGGTVEIKAVAREPGIRSKIAVFSKEEGVDPVGSVIGPLGNRVNAVIQELGGEKIDIIKFSEDPVEFIKNALSPARISKVKLKENRAEVFAPESQLPLAIGREGQNVKLASELTGWKIDIKPLKEE